GVLLVEDAMSETETESEADTEAGTETETEAETETETEAKAETETEAETETKIEAETETETEAETEAETFVTSENATISVTKKLTYDGYGLIAKDETFYVALYADEDCTERISEVKELHYANASATTATFTGLDLGRTYYIAECDQDGTRILSGALADGTLYFVDFSEGNEVVVEEEDGSVTKYFENQYMSIPNGGYFLEAELMLTKKLVSADGTALNSDAVFYAGIFTDASCTELSNIVSQNIVVLDMGGSSEVSVLVTAGIADGDTVTLYVAEVDADGVPVESGEDFLYEVNIDGSEVVLDTGEHIVSSVTITNQEIEVVEVESEITTEFETQAESETQTESGTQAKSETQAESETQTESASVKTGDDTPIGMYFNLFLAAFGILLAGSGYRKRRKY
ncbi:MAG: hypothetical protein LUD18_02670, partial [Lachnospiraceae bacterium]|nr:hypothetical protein [Lachnospiraceae bacterium]